MPIVKCPIPGCTYEADAEDTQIVVTLLNIHALTHKQPAHNPAPPQPKLDRPKIDIGVEEEVWNGFVRRWEAFKVGSGISDVTASMQLFQCATEALGDLILKADPNIQSKPVEEVKSQMREFAVIPVAIGVRRAELMQLRQAPDELFRTFAAKVKGKAETCMLSTSTTCYNCNEIVSADYMNETVRDVLLAGIADIDIRREALSTRDIQKRSINDVIAFVEGREMARNATPITSMSALSSFKKKQSHEHETIKRPPLPDTNKTALCPDCGKKFNMFKQRPNGTLNTKPHTKCLNCWRASRRKDEHTSLSSLSTEPAVSQIGAVYLNREVISKSDLRKTRNSNHPRVDLNIRLAEPNKNKNKPEAFVRGIVDSGAMSNLWGLKNFYESGFSKADLLNVNMDIRAANRNPINIVGAIKAVIIGKSPSGEEFSSTCVVYVSDCVNDFFLSYDSMLDLGIVSQSFPMVGAYSPLKCSPMKCPPMKYSPSTAEVPETHVRSVNSGCTGAPQGEHNCNCPQRESIPQRPTSLPFAAVPLNNEKMREWLLQRYSRSTFNTCPHRPLPCMTGPPVEIHVDETAQPKTCHTAASIPLHWQEQVHKDLVRDEALGVIEKVPYGEPVTWCHRMVVTRKHDGSPRRTVDLSPLNKFCKRETFSSEAPFPLARRIPGKTWKTVTDAWNGYHSVPLRESDRHLTTFITPFGRWRYTRAPQGFLSSGDGYNRRFDAILSNFERKERCVDDTCHYDDNLEEHWWRTIDFLSTCGAAGIVLNPDKFQFAQREVDFAGFRISEDKIRPLPKYIDAIKLFPTPKSTTDIRSWFGLINQVANYAQLRDALKLFRPFLSPKYKFFWSPILDKAFNQSKEAIVNAIYKGVEIFDIKKQTCLRPDWSKEGIGYLLLQKHCICESDLPDCCSEGWRITLAGSRFLNNAEQRYAAIEGEALAIAWGLEQTRYFTQGCHNLLVVTDHKPLQKIFGDRTLDEISNTRLFRLKQRTLPWHFRVKHMPGVTNSVADAMSRYPSPHVNESMSSADMSESMIASSISREVEDITAVSWDRIASETRKDSVLSALFSFLSSPNGHGQEIKPELSEYSGYLDSLYVSDGIILYKDRAVIPSSLRKTIVDGLHAAHQGVASMQLRAQSIIFWPGMTKDIHEVRARCMDCNTNAPSQAQLPSFPADPPTTPFEKVFADFFDYGGHHYLVIGDRLSGWPEVYSTPSGSAHAGARGLIACLRKFFATFGVPEELSSDGGPEFAASQTKDFLSKWGVYHRQSSAYHPQSNGRAEVAVKSVKRLLRSNVNPSGSLDSDKLLKALLQLRNTPDPDCKLSPAEIVFGHPIRDSFSFVNKLEKYSNKAIHPIWREAWAAKEIALRTRFIKTSEKLNERARNLDRMSIGDRCFVQNQTGNSPKRWDRTGTVVDAGAHDQYVIKIDGSGRLTSRNRRFLRKFQPASMIIQPAPAHNGPNDLQIASPPDSEEQTPIEQGLKPERAMSPELSLEPRSPESAMSPEPPLEPQSPERAMSPEPSLEPQFPEPQPSEPQSSDPPRAYAKLPASLQRLLPYNSTGLKEMIRPPQHGGRRLRNNKNKLPVP